jgi:hypothetical protein
VFQGIRALGARNLRNVAVAYRRLAEASEEGQDSQRTDEPMMMMMLLLLMMMND